MGMCGWERPEARLASVTLYLVSSPDGDAVAGGA